MKLHIGVDSQTGLAHSAVVTAANVHDKHPLPDLLHGQEQRVYGDSAYASQKELIHGKAPQPGLHQPAHGAQGQRDRGARGEEPQQVADARPGRACLRVVKRLWGFDKVRYRGLAKNATRAFVALALANIYLSRSPLMAQVRP